MQWIIRIKTRSLSKLLTFSALLVMLVPCFESAGAYTANKVWFEFRKNGRYRVYVNYTVPALREFRESFVEFRSKKKAEKYYFDLLKGADFYVPNSEDTKFVNHDLEPISW